MSSIEAEGRPSSRMCLCKILTMISGSICTSISDFVCILLRREHLLTCGVDSGLAILNSDRLACFFADEASSRVQYPTNFALNYCLFKIHTTENPRWRMSVRRKLCVRPPLSLVNAPFRASTTTSLGSRALSHF